MADILKHLRGRMLKAFAADAEPEDVAEAAEVLNQAPPPAEDKKGRDKRARDVEMEEDDHDIEAAVDACRRARDRRMRDAEFEEDNEPVYDAKRQAAHDALDDLLANEETGMDRKRARDKRVSDTDLEELKNLLTQFFSEEETEPAHASDDELEEDDEPVIDSEPLDEVLGNAEPGEAEDDEEDIFEEAEDDEVEPGEEELEDGEEELEPVGDRKHARDARPRVRAADAKDGAAAVLKMLRPVVARCNDSAMQNAFNTALASVTRSSRASGGGSSYGSFAGAARARDSRVPRAPITARMRATDSGGSNEDQRIARMQEAYDTALKGGK